ncbi:hypothetical protein VIGAN_04030100, partial [Vigna angularis var. angularis]
MVDMSPLVAMKQTPAFESSVTEGIAISSIKGGLLVPLSELKFPFSAVLASFSSEKNKYSTGCFISPTPGRLEIIVQGNQVITFMVLQFGNFLIKFTKVVANLERKLE